MGGGTFMNIDIAKMIDHTLLKPNATEEEIKKVCEEAREYGFASVCINPCFVDLAYKMLKDTDVKVCTVVGFPLGANTVETKVHEAVEAVKKGAKEIDMVLNISMMKSGKYEYVKREIEEVVKQAYGEEGLEKPALEPALWRLTQQVQISQPDPGKIRNLK